MLTEDFSEEKFHAEIHGLKICARGRRNHIASGDGTCKCGRFQGHRRTGRSTQRAALEGDSDVVHLLDAIDEAEIARRGAQPSE